MTRWRVLLFLVATTVIGSLAVIYPEAAYLGYTTDLSHWLEPGEVRMRTVALLSRLTARPTHTDDMAPILYTDVYPLGVNTFFDLEVEEGKVRRSLEMIRAAGIGWIRQQFRWDEIEIPSKGQYIDRATGRSSWEKYDRIVELTHVYGISILARLDTVPEWARPAGSTFTHPPTDPGDYADFVRAVVGRYKGRIHYYQLWNEPNLAFEWGNQNVSASGFIPLLRAGYLAVKEADPTAIVVAPALAATTDSGPANRNDLLYLRELYQAGGGAYFDIMSTQAYGLRSGPDDRRIDVDDVNFSRPILLREIMVDNGDSHKPIWISEMGWNALPVDFTEKPLYGRVTEEQQARYTVRALQRVHEEWPWVGVSFLWFFRRPDDHEIRQHFYYFRLVDPDFTPRPVYTAIAAWAPSLSAIGRGYHQASHWAIEYSGPWQGSGPTRRAASPGATFRLSFQGTTVAIDAQGSGRLVFSIDGGMPIVSDLPWDASGHPYLDLGSRPAPVTIARGLDDRPHTLEAMLVAGGVELHGVVVDREAAFPHGLILGAFLILLLWVVLWR